MSPQGVQAARPLQRGRQPGITGAGRVPEHSQRAGVSRGGAQGDWPRGLDTAVHSGPQRSTVVLAEPAGLQRGPRPLGAGQKAQDIVSYLKPPRPGAGVPYPLPPPSRPGAPGGSAALGPSGTEFLSSSQSLERSGEGPGLAKHGRLRLMLRTCGLCRGRGTGAGEGAGSSSVSHRRSVSPAPRLGGVFHTVNETAVAGQQQ